MSGAKDYNSKIRNVYVRSLLFAVALLLVSVACFFLSGLEVLRPYSILWLIIACGTLAVVIRTIRAIHAFVKQLQANANNALANMTATTCPDYWTRDTVNKQCTNTYVTPDNNYIYVIGGGSNNAPLVMDTTQPLSCAGSNLGYPYTYRDTLCSAIAVGSLVPPTTSAQCAPTAS